MIQEKWARYISMVRKNEPEAEQAVKLDGANNLTATRYLRICTKVDIYLRDRRIATDAELQAFVHESHENQENEDMESVSDDEPDVDEE